VPTNAVPQVALVPSAAVSATAPVGATCIELQAPVSLRMARSTWTSPPGVCEIAVATAFQEGEGIAVVLCPAGRLRFTEFAACSSCDSPAPSVTPALFSFNNPRGACSNCNGFGAVLEYDESLIIPDPTKSLADGAIDPWTKPRYESRRRILGDFARSIGADPGKAWSKLKAMSGGPLPTNS